MPVVFTPYLRKAAERVTSDDARGVPDEAGAGRRRGQPWSWLALGAAATAAVALLVARRRRADSTDAQSGR